MSNPVSIAKVPLISAMRIQSISFSSLVVVFSAGVAAKVEPAVIHSSPSHHLCAHDQPIFSFHS